MPNLFLLSDTHLGRDMSPFGPLWVNHVEQIRANWDTHVAPDDVVLVPGDITWAKTLAEAKSHLEWLDARPGRYKILVKGNHDWWWSTTTKVRAALPKSLIALDADAVAIDGLIVGGTKGYLTPCDPYFQAPDDDHAFKTNYQRAMRALEAIQKLRLTNSACPVVYCLHYPPFTSDGKESEFSRLIEAAGCVSHCVFGHFHIEAEWTACPQGNRNGVNYWLGSTDYLKHMPRKLIRLEF